MGKGEIAGDEQFLLFPQCFQKVCFPGASKGVIVWEWVKDTFFSSLLTLNLSSTNAFSRDKYKICPKKIFVSMDTGNRLQDLKAGSLLFSPRLVQFLFQDWSYRQNLLFLLPTPIIVLTMVFVRKRPVAWKEYRAKCFKNEPQQSMDRCTDRPGLRE